MNLQLNMATKITILIVEMTNSFLQCVTENSFSLFHLISQIINT